MLISLLRAGGAFVLAAALSACSVVGGQAAPEPMYTVVTRAEPVELRDYPALVVARTEMAEGTRGAFGRLFDYISGENSGRREIAMTAPVLEREGTKIAMTAPVLRTDGRAENGAREMAFILPADFSAETAPLPTDPAVRLDIVPARRVAVLTFSGVATDESFGENRARLEEWIASRGLTATGPAELAQYNPPWTVPAMRRNEVLIPVSGE